MGFFSNLFGKNEASTTSQPIYVDIHSHLLPAIDDGAKNIQESVELIKRFSELEYKKLITTPHIMGDYYKNTPEIIMQQLDMVRKAIADNQINIELEAAAEYYVDESLVNKLKNNEQLLTFGDNFLLIETSYLNEPANLSDLIALIKDKGYWPILAHPERYHYLYQSTERFEQLYSLDITFQININSVAGYYGKQAKYYANKLVEKSMVGFIGSDCHSLKHMDVLEQTRKTKEYARLSNKVFV